MINLSNHTLYFGTDYAMILISHLHIGCGLDSRYLRINPSSMIKQLSKSEQLILNLFIVVKFQKNYTDYTNTTNNTFIGYLL